MATGDPTWPCGCIDWSMGALVKPEKCPNCFPEQRRFFSQQSSMETASYEKVKNTFDNLRELCKKHDFSATILHDEIIFDGPEENRVAFLEDLHASCLEKAKEIMAQHLADVDLSKLHNGYPGKTCLDHVVDAAIHATTGTMTGRMSSKSPNKSSYPREEGEPYCKGCGRELPILRRDVEKVEWRAYHIIPEEGSEYFCRREFYHQFTKKDFKREVLGEFVPFSETVPGYRRHVFPMSRAVRKSTSLGDWKKIQGPSSDLWMYTISVDPGYDEVLLSQFQATQQFADRRNPAFQTSKELLEENPTASSNWSAALRIKIKASEEAREREENMHWDPYGDWED